MFVRKFQEKSLNPMKKWYDSPITTDAGFIIENGKTVTHGSFIEEIAENIDHILENYGYSITNRDDFFNELIHIIYSVSDNS
tara:strand:- start:562 stop:807 length:246 start_codon:yes stop_codon:yes gene_type:complete